MSADVTAPQARPADPTRADIDAAAVRIAGYVSRTPCIRSDWLSAATGADVLLKLELTQYTGSFKLRGAMHAVRRIVDAPRLAPVSPCRGSVRKRFRFLLRGRLDPRAILARNVRLRVPPWTTSGALGAPHAASLQCIPTSWRLGDERD